MGGAGILAGVALTLFGVRSLRKGLDRLLGGSLVRWVARLTRDRWRAFGAGVAIGVAAPSSTGLAMLGPQLIGQRAGGGGTSLLALLLGANIGLTVTTYLLAVPADAVLPVFIVAGVAGFQFCRRDLWRGLGQCTLALAFIFMAMRLIGDGAAAVAGVPELSALFRLCNGHPLRVAAASAVMAVALQSSTATVALGVGLAGSGLIAPAMLVPWIGGTNVGLGITSVVAGWAQAESRRVGFENVIAKAATFLLWLWLAPDLWRLAESLSPLLSLRGAMLHTAFNGAVALLALPSLGGLQAVGRFLVPPSRDAGDGPRGTFLERDALDVPSLALAHATREALTMADHARAMLTAAWRAMTEHDPVLARSVQKQDDVLDRMNLEIKDYLSRITENRLVEDTRWQFALLAFVNDLESAGDLVDKHLCDALLKPESLPAQPDAEDLASLTEVYRTVLGTLDLATGILTTRDPRAAARMLADKQRFNDRCRELQREHYERLAITKGSALAGSAFFLEWLNALRRINSHLSTIGYVFERPQARVAGGETTGAARAL